MINLARAFDLAGQRDSAIVYFQRFVDTPHSFLFEDQDWLAGSYKRLGELYEAAGDLPKAVTNLEKFVELWKDADPELQPKVRDARERLTRVRAELARRASAGFRLRLQYPHQPQPITPMRTYYRVAVSLAILLAACTAQGCVTAADTVTSAGRAGSTLTTDLRGGPRPRLEKKMVDLASAIPENKYNWQPDSARSVRQVLLHVAADNYLMPAMLGHTPDPATGITTDYNTARGVRGAEPAKGLRGRGAHEVVRVHQAVADIDRARPSSGNQ